MHRKPLYQVAVIYLALNRRYLEYSGVSQLGSQYKCSADSCVSSNVCHMPHSLLAGSVHDALLLWMLVLQLLPS